MKSITHKSSRRILSKKPDKSLEWAKFELLRQVIHALLVLLWLFVLAILGLIAAGKIKITDAAIGLFISGAIGCVGTVLNNIVKSWLKPKD